ncbi:hypothetical protein MNBD_GAMMA12-3114 [hydrothermal vent metagenome]|uniref:Uncharacterized protein n=1 Tax=hydrothermal vent metagenome TaxID=652676 RepID=A0A3B0YMZ8_9ZZZZ
MIKNLKCYCNITFVVSLIILSTHSQKLQAQQLDKPELKQKVEVQQNIPNAYMGQYYPSGRVYLRAPNNRSNLRDPSSYNNFKWPEKLAIIPIPFLNIIDRKKTKPIKIKTATYERVLTKKFINNHLFTSYIPNYEEMDDHHDFCGLPTKKHKKKKHKLTYGYNSNDFYSALSFHCESIEQLRLYTTKPSALSYTVIAVPVSTAINYVRYVSGKRPISISEKIEIRKWKLGIAKLTKDYDCNYEPSYFDSAIMIAMIHLKGSKDKIRLSYYENPGCAGHQTIVYLIDILHNTNIKHRYFYVQYQGAL